MDEQIVHCLDVLGKQTHDVILSLSVSRFVRTAGGTGDARRNAAPPS